MLEKSNKPARLAGLALFAAPLLRARVSSYVGSSEGLRRADLPVGDGVYESTDAGTTCTHLGLRDGSRSQRGVDGRSGLPIAAVPHDAARGVGQGPRTVDGARGRRGSARRDAVVESLKATLSESPRLDGRPR